MSEEQPSWEARVSHWLWPQTWPPVTRLQATGCLIGLVFLVLLLGLPLLIIELV